MRRPQRLHDELTAGVVERRRATLAALRAGVRTRLSLRDRALTRGDAGAVAHEEEAILHLEGWIGRLESRHATHERARRRE